jgi:hypothetical protein
MLNEDGFFLTCQNGLPLNEFYKRVCKGIGYGTDRRTDTYVIYSLGNTSLKMEQVLIRSTIKEKGGHFRFYSRL